MTFANLIDPVSLAIVLGGTCIATLLRCGWREVVITAGEIRQLLGEPFDADVARAELARQIQDIQRDGLVRAQPHHFGDREFDEVADVLINQRSIAALLGSHEKHKKRRQRLSNTAVRLFAQAAELAPVFGMVGTLISLNKLAGGASSENFTAAIAMAVLTTLYGLLVANLIFAPLSRVIERAAEREELERQRLVDWLARQVHEACPDAGPFERRSRAREVA